MTMRSTRGVSPGSGPAPARRVGQGRVDGSEPAGVTIRVVAPTDFDRIRRMWPRLSRQTVYRRFHAPIHQFPAAPVQQFVTGDHELRDAVVAIRDDEIVGLARYEQLAAEPSTAEFAVVVQDDCQGTGLGRRLLDAVLGLARARGIGWMTGSIVADNKPMLELLRRHFPRGELHLKQGIYEVRIPLGPHGDPPER